MQGEWRQEPQGPTWYNKGSNWRSRIQGGRMYEEKKYVGSKHKGMNHNDKGSNHRPRKQKQESGGSTPWIQEP